MKIVTGSTGLPHVTSNDDGEFNQGIYGDGLVVLNNGYQLEAEIRDANTITIKDGDLVFQGRHALIEPGTTEDVTIETGTIGTKRNDLIVAHYEIDQGTGYEAITLETITGTESSTPVDPPYTEGDIRTGSIIAEVPLYRVRLNGINIDEIDALFTPQERSLLGDIEKINTDLSDRTSHIGQIIMSTTLNNENAVKAIYGGNSWELLTDKFLVGAGSSYSVKATGGEATHTLTTDEMPSHNHGGDTGQDGWHTHNVGLANSTGSNANMPTGGTFWGWNSSVLQGNGAHTHTISSQGSGQPHNNLPPYYAVYIWHRVS